MRKITLLLLLLTMSTLFAQIRPLTRPMRVTQAEQAEYNLMASNWKYVDSYEQYGCTQFILYTDNVTFYFAITLPLASIKNNTVYTLDNMDTEGTWCETVVSGEEQQEYYLMDAAQFKIYRDDQQRVHIKAVVTIGGTILNITYGNPDAPTEFTTVDLTMTNVSMNQNQAQGYCEFRGFSTDGVYRAILDYNTTGSVTGEFDENSCVANYNVFMNGEDKLQLVKVTAKVVDIENGYKAEGWFYANDGNCYHCTFIYALPKPTTQVTIIVDTAKVDDQVHQSGFIDIYAISTDYSMQLEINTSNIPGTYTEANLSKNSYFIDPQNEQYTVYRANVTIEEVTEGVYHIIGTILCYGDIEFTIDITNILTGKYHIGDLCYNLKNNYTAEVIYQSSGDENYLGLTTINIPSSVTCGGKAYRVTSIGDSAFYACNSLQYVTIGDAITSIGKNVFVGTQSYKNSSNWDNGVLYIDKWQIKTNTDIEGIYTIKENTRGIADEAFSDCRKLYSVIVPNGVTHIGKRAFKDCAWLNYVSLPQTLVNIGQNAFYNCQYLQEAAIPNLVTGIEDSLFYNCSHLKSVAIGNSVKSIGTNAFYGCKELTSVNIFDVAAWCSISFNDNPLYYANNLYLNSKLVTTLVIPNGVTNIGKHAFSHCTSFTSVTIPSSVTSIEDYAFSETKLKSIICYSPTPPAIDEQYKFKYNVSSSIPIYVPANNLMNYKSHYIWGKLNIQVLPADYVNTQTVTFNPSEYSTTITWPSVENAYTYEIVISDTHGNVACTITFNANGQLLDVIYAAPCRNAFEQIQQQGFKYMITGLESGMTYTCSLTAQDENGKIIQIYTGEFTTESTTGIDVMEKDDTTSVRKVLQNGQLYILHDGKIFNAVGAEVK